MEVEKPSPEIPAALLLSVVLVAVAWDAGIEVPVIPVFPALAGVCWLVFRGQSWLWREFGRVTRVIVPLAPVTGFGALYGLNQMTTLAVPGVPGGLLVVIALLAFGAWLSFSIRSWHIVDRGQSQRYLLSWTGISPKATRIKRSSWTVFGSVGGIVLAQSIVGNFEELLSLETYLPTLIGSALGAGLMVALGVAAKRDSTTFTALEDGLLIDSVRFVPASDIEGYELTDSTLVIETESRLNSILGTRRFGSYKIRREDIGNVDEICHVLDQYQTVGATLYQQGPRETSTV